MILRSFFHSVKVYFNSLKSPIKQAKEVGLVFGKDNEFQDCFWSSAEPYLIEIGNNCQITSGVKFFTHGGGKNSKI